MSPQEHPRWCERKHGWCATDHSRFLEPVAGAPEHDGQVLPVVRLDDRAPEPRIVLNITHWRPGLEVDHDVVLDAPGAAALVQRLGEALARVLTD